VLLAAILAFATSVARAETIVNVSDDHGGLLFAYQLQWAGLATQKVSVRIAGPCVSACTVLLGYIPRENICVTPNASLGFHLATMQFATDALWRAYPQDIRAWIEKNGGLTYQVIYLHAPAIYRFLQKCRVGARP
jgi:hypothetical protein